MKLRTLSASMMLASAGLLAHPAFANVSDNVIRIGFITDMASVYSDIDGAGGVEAARMAIADAGGQIDGKKIELVFADHQNKADVAAARAREWFDQQKIDMLIGGTNSGVNLALAGIAAERKKPFFAIGAAASDLTGSQCTPYTVHFLHREL